MVKQTDRMEGEGFWGPTGSKPIRAGTRSDRDPQTPLQPETSCKAALGDDWSPRGHVPSFFSSRTRNPKARAGKVWRTRLEVLRASISFENISQRAVPGCTYRHIGWMFQGRALSGAVREDRGPATWHREQRGRGPSSKVCSSIRPSGNTKSVPRIPYRKFLPNMWKRPVREKQQGVKRPSLAPNASSNRRAGRVWWDSAVAR